MTNEKKIEIFEEAFKLHGSTGSERFCECGKIFYNSDGGWDWEDGRLEWLRKQKHAVDVDYSVGTLDFEGKQYCLDCNCWHERALRIFAFLVSHNSCIVALFRAVKKYELEKAESIAVE